MNRGIVLVISVVLTLFSCVEVRGQGKKKIIPESLQQKDRPLKQLLPKVGATDEVKIKLFFPAHGDQNPTSDPNWFYYWTDGLGYSGQYSYDANLTVYGRAVVMSATSWRITIGPSAYSSTGIPPTGNKYINGFKAVILHEFWHRDHRVYNYSTYGVWGGLPLSVDPDQDDIDNTWEAKIGTDPNVWNSTEDGAEWAEIHGTYGHESIDWAFPGSQLE